MNLQIQNLQEDQVHHLLDIWILCKPKFVCTHWLKGSFCVHLTTAAKGRLGRFSATFWLSARSEDLRTLLEVIPVTRHPVCDLWPVRCRQGKPHLLVPNMFQDRKKVWWFRFSFISYQNRLRNLWFGNREKWIEVYPRSNHSGQYSVSLISKVFLFARELVWRKGHCDEHINCWLKAYSLVVPIAHWGP